jgi:hypothetical protein
LIRETDKSGQNRGEKARHGACDAQHHRKPAV